MEISFEYTDADLKDAIRGHLEHECSTMVPILIGLAVAGGVLGWFLSKSAWYAAAFPVLVVLTAAIVFERAYRTYIRAWAAIFKKTGRAVRIEADAEGFRISTPGKESRRLWKSLAGINETKSQVLLYVSRRTFINIPGRAFGSDERRADFMKMARRGLLGEEHNA